MSKNENGSDVVTDAERTQKRGKFLDALKWHASMHLQEVAYGFFFAAGMLALNVLVGGIAGKPKRLTRPPQDDGPGA